MLYNYSKLIGRIIEKFGTQAAFAEAMKLSERSISLKLNNKVEWKQGEILCASKLLNFSQMEIPDYFFDLSGQFGKYEQGIERSLNWLSINLPQNCPNVCISFIREIAEMQIKKFGAKPLYGLDDRKDWLPVEIFITYGGLLAPDQRLQET